MLVQLVVDPAAHRALRDTGRDRAPEHPRQRESDAVEQREDRVVLVIQARQASRRGLALRGPDAEERVDVGGECADALRSRCLAGPCFGRVRARGRAQNPPHGAALYLRNLASLTDQRPDDLSIRMLLAILVQLALGLEGDGRRQRLVGRTHALRRRRWRGGLALPAGRLAALGLCARAGRG